MGPLTLGEKGNNGLVDSCLVHPVRTYFKIWPTYNVVQRFLLTDGEIGDAERRKCGTPKIDQIERSHDTFS
jgi:hypothetical protein